MIDYTVRFSRGNRGWTCSVFPLGADGRIAGGSVTEGTGHTKDDAKAAALGLTNDATIRAVLAGSDSRTPYWVQGRLGEEQERLRHAAPRETTTRRRTRS